MMFQALSSLLQCDTTWCCGVKFTLLMMILVRLIFLYSRHKKIDKISQRLDSIQELGISMIDSVQ